jgi:hypothetical protein
MKLNQVTEVLFGINDWLELGILVDWIRPQKMLKSENLSSKLKFVSLTLEKQKSIKSSWNHKKWSKYSSRFHEKPTLLILSLLVQIFSKAEWFLTASWNWIINLIRNCVCCNNHLILNFIHLKIWIKADIKCLFQFILHSSMFTHFLHQKSKQNHLYQSKYKKFHEFKKNAFIFTKET